jgi:cell division protein FtsQ
MLASAGKLHVMISTVTPRPANKPSAAVVSAAVASGSGQGARSLASRVWFSTLCVSVLIALGAIGFGVLQVRSGNFFPLEKVTIESRFERLSAEQIRALVSDEMQDGFFSVDLIAIRENLRVEPWVQRVEVRKRWPDTILLRVIERAAVARWGNDALIDSAGEIFQAAGAESIEGLPHLHGPESHRAELLDFYDRSQPSLQPLNLHITHARFSPRGALTVQLSDGARVILGREQTAERWQRLVDNLPTLISKNPNQRLIEVDLRYTNGLAARFEQIAPTIEAPASAPNPGTPPARSNEGQSAPSNRAVLAAIPSDVFAVSPDRRDLSSVSPDRRDLVPARPARLMQQ